MEMRIFAYNSNVLLVMATLTLDRNEAIKTDFINLINSATDMGALEKLYKQAKRLCLHLLLKFRKRTEIARSISLLDLLRLVEK